MKKSLYRVIGKESKINLVWYYLPKTEAEKMAKEANKEIQKRFGHIAERYISEKVKYYSF